MDYGLQGMIWEIEAEGKGLEEIMMLKQDSKPKN